MSDDHYLRDELYRKACEDSAIFEFLQEGSLDGLWYWDLENPEHEWMSPRFWELLGYDPATKEHRADAWKELIDPDDLELATQNLKRHCEDPGFPYDQLVRYRHKSGSTVWVRCRGIAIRDAQGKPVRMLGAHTDLTALKNAELALRDQAQALRDANQQLEQFVYVASHDLREPLRMVVSFAGLLETQCRDQLDEKATKYLDFAVDGARRMQQLIDDLLIMSRLCSDQSPRVDVDLNGAVAAAARGLEVRYPRAEVHYRDLPVIDAITGQIDRMLVSLLDNACKFNASEAPRVQVEASEDPAGWTVVVRDNGIGIEPRRAPEVFEMFRRLHKRSDYPGTGIGLALVKQVVTRHGGEVAVRAVPGGGSEFILTLARRHAGRYPVADSPRWTVS